MQGATTARAAYVLRWGAPVSVDANAAPQRMKAMSITTCNERERCRAIASARAVRRT